MSSPRVFVSYSTDSKEHSLFVLALCDRLREDGVDAWIDQYESAPCEGWPRWMDRQIREADFILAVCTETYCRRFEGREDGVTGRGVTWEGLIAEQLIYEAKGLNSRILPIRLCNEEAIVPLALRPYTAYRLPDDYSDLFRRIIAQPRTTPPPLSPLANPAHVDMRHVSTRNKGLDVESRVHELDDSPFVVGPAISEDAHFLGRFRQRDEIAQAMAVRQSVQVVGERRMGKTSLLRWVERHLSIGQRCVSINVQGLDGRSPRALVRRIAERLRVESYSEDPEQALVAFCPLLLILDEADALADLGHSFDEGFFNTCRALCQDGRLTWISASRRPLFSEFQSTGLTSSFLNDARTVWVGQLEAPAIETLIARGAGEAGTRAAGGWAYGLQWVGDARWRRSSADGEVVDHFAIAVRGIFSSWWAELTVRERTLLFRLLEPVKVTSLSDVDRRRARALTLRGLLSEREGVIGLPGCAWAGFIAEVKDE